MKSRIVRLSDLQCPTCGKCTLSAKEVFLIQDTGKCFDCSKSKKKRRKRDA